jgi:eukaryotic-like serine/threonine-protein kinase
VLTWPDPMARSAKHDSHDKAPRNLGRYHLYGELASGGMATVHLGRQVGSGGFSKMVAIKRLHPQFGKMEEFVEMFLAEARLAARIRHPNVVQPLDVLRVDDEVFLVMEYVEGDSLSRLMKGTISRQEKVPLPIAISILSGVLRGLHAAHEAKSDKGEPLELVHRDISPQNVLVGVDGAARVIDFGIAKAADSVQVTREGELKGKLAYMAPEILSGRRGTRRADIYAAGVVLWEVLTAQRLFDADYQSAILNNILHRPVDRPSDFVEGLPPQLDAIVLKGLARDPSDRFATAREMAQAIEEAVPPASLSIVGEWVEVVAAASLAQRGSRIAEIELQSVEEEAPELQPEEVKSEMLVRASLNPPLSVPKNPTIPTLQGVGGGGYPAPPTPLPPPASAFSSGFSSPAWQGPGLIAAPEHKEPPPTIHPQQPSAPSFGEGPSWPVEGIPHAPMGETLQVGPVKRSSGSGIVTFVLAIALLLAVVYVGLPELLKRRYIGAAAQAGVTLSIDSVRMGLRKAQVSGVTATFNQVPGVTLHIQTIDIALSYGLDATDAAVHQVLLSIEGAPATAEDGLHKWQTGHDLGALLPASLGHVTVDAGHLVWPGAFGQGSRVEAENIALDMARSRDAAWDDVNFASPLVGIVAPWGKLGPWAMSGQGEHGRIKATLALDPSGTSRADLVVSLEGSTVSALDLTLPRSNVALLGISAALLGRRPEDPLFVEGTAHYAAPSAQRVQASVHLALSGARLPNAAAGAEAQLDAQLDGDPARPIDVAGGTFAFGPFRGRTTGGVTFGPTFVRVDLALKTGAVRCATGGDVALGGGLQLDTRSLADARIVVTPSGHCGLRILPL